MRFQARVHGLDSAHSVYTVPEVQGTTVEVAIEKCKRAAELVRRHFLFTLSNHAQSLQINGPCITEDTALAFKALGGLPGPYIKHFMAELGHEGLNKMLVGFDDKGAEAICTFAYSAGPGTEPLIFEGRTEGKIVQARGTKVFGWDPIFEPTVSGGLTCVFYHFWIGCPLTT